MKSLQPTLYLMVKTETISHKIRNKTRMPRIPTAIQRSPEILAKAIRQKEEIKIIQIGKETVKIYLFADNNRCYTSKTQKPLPPNS
jgi:hypothetical protein